MVELTDEEVRWAAFAFEVQLQQHARNGRGLAADDPRRLFAAKLARAAPVAAVTYCLALLRTAGPEVTAEVRLLASILDIAGQGVAEVAQRGSQPAPLELTARQVAELTGYTIHGVRTACRRGRLEATKTEDGWVITRRAVDEWRARSAA